MSLLATASRRFLFRHPGQLALTVLGVALGVAVVVAIDLAIQSSRAGFRASTEAVAGRTTHSIIGSADDLPDSLFTALRVDLGIRRAAPIVEGYVRSDAFPGQALRLLGVDPFSERPFRDYLGVDGPEIDVGQFVTRPNSLLLPEGMADSLRVGDSLSIVVGGRRLTASVGGVMAPGNGIRSGLDGLLLSDIGTAQHILEMPGRLSRIDLILPEGPDGDALIASVQSLLPPGARIEAAGLRADQMAGMLRAFDLNLTALSLLALVFGMFLIYNAMTFSVVQRRELLGSLRTLGVTRSEIVRMVTGEALITAAAGTALGLIGGVVLGRGLVRLVTQTINDLYFVLSVEGVVLQPAVLIKGTFLGLAATLLATLPAVLEAVRSQPRASTTRSVIEDRARVMVPRAASLGLLLMLLGGAAFLVPSRSLTLSFLGLSGTLLGLALLTPLATVAVVALLRPVLAATIGILGVLAARGVVQSLSRTAPAVAALVVAVSVTVGLGVMITSFRTSVARWLDYTLQADIYVSPPSLVASRADGVLPDDLVQRLLSAPEVSGANTYRGATLTGPDGPINLMAVDMDPRGESSLSFIEGDRQSAFEAFHAGQGAFVSEPWAWRNAMAVGDTLRLPATNGVLALPVMAVYTDYGSDQGVVMIGRQAWDRGWNDDRVTSMGLFLHPGMDAEAVVARLRTLVGPDQVAVIRSNVTLRTGSLEVFDRTFAITSVLRALAFVVAFIGVLSALMALQMERARELGVLRANGLTPGQVWGLVTAQTGLLGTIAGLLAVPAGILLAIIMIFVVNRRSFGWTLQLELGAGVLVQTVLLAVVGALLAGLYPAWKMSRTPPALALREE